jgi:hypothetical protein
MGENEWLVKIMIKNMISQSFFLYSVSEKKISNVFLLKCTIYNLALSYSAAAAHDLT